MSLSAEIVLVQLCKLDCNFLQYVGKNNRFTLRSVTKRLYDTLLPFNVTDKKLTWYAAYTGNLELLKWTRQNVRPFNEWTCMYAAKGGHLDVLKWAHENGCPWNVSTCMYAAEGGHLDVLKWAIDNRCDHNQEHLRVLQDLQH